MISLLRAVIYHILTLPALLLYVPFFLVSFIFDMVGNQGTYYGGTYRVQGTAAPDWKWGWAKNVQWHHLAEVLVGYLFLGWLASLWWYMAVHPVPPLVAAVYCVVTSVIWYIVLQRWAKP